MSERERELEALLSECRVVFDIFSVVLGNQQALYLSHRITAVLSKPKSEAA